MSEIKNVSPANSTQACRQSAKTVIEDRVKRLSGEYETLMMLVRIIPWDDLKKEEEAALWKLFIKM